MRKILMISLCLILSILTSCASRYRKINPEEINYVSKGQDENKTVSLEYKYDLLHKKYRKKEKKKDIKLVAIKVTNNSEQDLVLGRDIKILYSNGNEPHILDSNRVYDELKQQSAWYLFYLLLTPLNFSTTDSNGEVSNTTPIGLVVGPGLTAGNMLGASGANKNFEKELIHYDIYGSEIYSGQTKFGLIGIEADSFESLTIEVVE